MNPKSWPESFRVTFDRLRVTTDILAEDCGRLSNFLIFVIGGWPFGLLLLIDLSSRGCDWRFLTYLNYFWWLLGLLLTLLKPYFFPSNAQQLLDLILNLVILAIISWYM